MATEKPSTDDEDLAARYLAARERRAVTLKHMDGALARLIELHRIPTPEPLRGRLLAEADTVRELELMHLAGTDAPVRLDDALLGEQGRDAAAVIDALKQGNPDWQNARWETLGRRERNRARQYLRSSLIRGRPSFPYPDLLLPMPLAASLDPETGLPIFTLIKDKRGLVAIIEDETGQRLGYSRNWWKGNAPCGPPFKLLLGAVHYACFARPPLKAETLVKLLRKLRG